MQGFRDYELLLKTATGCWEPHGFTMWMTMARLLLPNLNRFKLDTEAKG